MASCSANGSNGHHKVTLNVTQGSQSTANNTTTINYSVVLSPLDDGWDWRYSNSDPFTCSYTINGTTRTCTLRVYDGSSTVTLASGSQTVSHNSDGTKTVSFSFSVTSQSASYLIGSCSASGSITLTTIPRASTFTASNGTLGTSQTFTVTRASTSFTHTLTYKVGSATGTIGSAKTTGNLTWTPPTSLASQNTTGSSLSCTLTLTTYSGSTSIGTSSKTITLTIPAGNPSFTLGTSDTKGYLSTYSGYIKTKSVIRTSLTSVSCTYSASVKSYSVTYRKTNASGASLATGSTATTDWTPNWAGTVHITATVTDSRGRSTSKTTTVTVLDYANPVINTLTVGRYSDSAGTTKNDAGDYAKVTYAGTYTSLSNKNSANITIKYKKHSDSTWTTAVNASTTLSGSTPTFEADAGSTYDVVAEIKDNFNTTAITKTATISTAAVLMHWRANGNGIAFGKMTEEDDVFDIGFSVLRIKRNSEPSLVMHRTDTDNTGSIYLWKSSDGTDPGFAFRFKAAGETAWTYSAAITKDLIRPYSNKQTSLGTSSLQWKNIYGATIYENGTSLANKYHPKMELTNLGATSSKAVANNTWVTVQTNTFTKAGTYLIVAYADWTSSFNSQTNFRLRLSRSGDSSVAERTVRFNASGGGGAVNSVFWSVSANDVLNMDAWQASGSSKNASTAGHWLKLS